MASLTGSTIASTYKDLLQVSNSNSGIDGTARVVSDGEDTASKLFLDTNRVGVGIAPTEGTLHVHTATADGGGETATADGAADDLVVENSGAGGITILTPNNALGQLAFGSPADAYGAFIGWKSDDNQMTIATANAGDSMVLQTANKTTALTIDSSQNATFAKGVTISNGNLDIASTKKLFFDAGGDTYIHEQSADKLDFFVGNGTRMVLDANSRISLANNDSGSGNTIFGYLAGENIESTNTQNNTFIGLKVGYAGTFSSAQGNTGVGWYALNDLTSADNNVAVGQIAMENITSGNENVAVGSRALSTATTATYNVAVGGDAMFGIPAGEAVTGVVAVGLEACKGDSNTDTTINNTVAVGRSALKLLRTGGNCTAVGYQALADNLSGYNNTALGYQALANATGGGNSSLGSQAGDLIITGTNNTLLGSASEVSANSATNQTVIGQGATGQADNSVVLGNADVTDVYMAQDSQAIVHAQNVPNHVANTMSSPYYRFDDVDDSITISNFPLVAQTSASGGYSIECLFRYSTGSGSFRGLFEFGDQATGERRSLVLNGSKLAVSHYSDNHSATTDLVDGQIYHAVSTVSSSGAVTMYLNGVAEAISSGDGTVVLTSYSGTTAYIGRTGSGEYFGGEIYHVKVFNNTLTATEVKELYSGMSVPFKYKGASQLELIASANNRTFAGASNWENVSFNSFDSTGDLSITASAVNQQVRFHQAYFHSYGNTVVGKRYRLTFDVANIVSSFTFKAYDGAPVYGTVDSNGTGQSIEFTAEDSGGLRIYSNADNSSADFDNFSLVQIGAVCEFDGSSAGSKVWGDKSGNDLHGTVGAGTLDATAPTLENTPYDAGTEYEEGDHVATIVGSTSGSYGLDGTNNVLRYTRIGRLVNIQGLLLVTSDNSASGTLRISLPFTIADGTGLGGRSYGSAYLDSYNSTIAGRINTKLVEGDAYFILVQVIDSGAPTDINDSQVDDTFNIGVNFSYTV